MSDNEAFDRQKGSSKKSTAAETNRLTPAMKRTSSRHARPAAKAKHIVVSGDTLSGLAQQYYGSAARENWMAIYEANKAEIGDNPSAIRVGQVLQIPELDK